MNDPDPQLALEELLRRVADVRHDLKNPLSIISGNVQLLREMARTMELDDDFQEGLNDINEAAGRIRDSLDRVDDLKETLAEQQEEAA